MLIRLSISASNGSHSIMPTIISTTDSTMILYVFCEGCVVISADHGADRSFAVKPVHRPSSAG